MRTEVEIREGIGKIEQHIKAYGVSERDVYKQISSAQIRMLKWVLGEELPPFYFCSACQYQHEGLPCPICGNANV